MESDLPLNKFVALSNENKRTHDEKKFDDENEIIQRRASSLYSEKVTITIV